MIEEIRAARQRISGLVAETPVLRVPEIDARCGGRIVLKAESLQHSGSFKLRGASAKLTAPGAGERGVAAGTAGNHGHALALAARRRGVPCDLFVPTDAPVSKIFPATRLGATIHPCEGTVDDCVVEAVEFAEREGLTFVHPFDDPEVIAGQGTVGLDLLEQVDDLARVLVPLGGGGLASGIAIAVKSERPEVEVVGVQVELEAAKTIADGIAVKRPGEVTTPLIERWLDRVVVVGEEDVGDAMAILLGEAKLVVEGAGAVGLAALLGGEEHAAAEGATVVVLSGGNIDEERLIAVARRSEAQHGRGMVLFTTISDRPGSLARLLERVAATGANVVDVRHLREGVSLGLAETGVELILETRGAEHAASIVAELNEDGYPVTEVSQPDPREEETR